MDFKMKIQKFGGFLAGMVIPNIGAFIAWGLITALFLDSGWFPNKDLATMIGPMLQFLLPILIAFTGGRMIYGQRGAVAGVVAASGAIFGSEIPMFLAAMILGPIGAVVIKKVDELLEGKIKSGFEMLVNNFSIGIVGMLMAVVSFYIVGPFIGAATNAATAGINVIIDAKLLPLLAIIIEPAKVLFLNNAIDQGIFVPLGAAEILEHGGKTLFYMLVSSPAPGAGILLAYSYFGKGNSKKSAPSALLIQFVGGIHEVYFPYVLMKPVMFLAVIGGGIAQIIVWVLLKAGLAGYPHPGSIISFIIMLPKGGAISVLLGILAGIAASFFIAAFFLKIDKSSGEEEDVSLSDDIGEMLGVPVEKKGQSNSVIKNSYKVEDIKLIVFACDAGIGSSAMGSGIVKKKVREAGLDIQVENFAVDSVPKDVKVIVTHENLYDRAVLAAPNAVVRTVKSFLNDPEYDILVADLLEGEVSSCK
ncbi:PTS mannitol transporter subunit IICB [Vagococcus intermedius]|uniref:PTS system mannitol-specific EIICB component n=1 Tax=Vagococcus intermedius TaxID=2991418 RepID=A0AAF0CU65_9ENTE|nr:PTS mannitol transporter subunit IICB [Vagococcus intermedius]WEG73075.1 PTS mannitol transporter subunit IICB [Vagococcus intermedius]WEG75159.1 PTS mannitol transporter subunit IICB [Vagococcus intermedius]